MPTVNDVTQLNRMPVLSVITPTSTQEVVDILIRTDFPVSVGGGHFSMGGQTASPNTLHLDMRQMNRVLRFDPQAGVICVQAGIRWCDIQRFVDPHGLAVKIMQTYANFTVGGALSVNAHGRYVGLGPVVLSVRAITLVLASGEVVEATRTTNSQLFNAAIGGYGGIGIIVEAELDLAPNTRVARSDKKMETTRYKAWFDANIRAREEVVFHNFDLYPPRYTRGRAVSWTVTDAPATAPRLQPLTRGFWLAKYLLWAITETPLGKFRREYLYDPLLHFGRKVHWRNYEAGYDVAELEPVDRTRRTYVLQEFFVPSDAVGSFAAPMGTILAKHRVNVVNISVRHALEDNHTVMAWTRGETFAFVLYYKQRTRESAKARVAVWTRELIDAVLTVDGTYYLPYQLHATDEQFHRAYPRAQEMFALKSELDPRYRLRGALWDRYYAPRIVTGPPHVRAMKKHLCLTGSVTLVNDVPPGMGPIDIVERGQLRRPGGFVPLNGYAPITLPAQSADLVSCFIGLHHTAPSHLTPFLESIARITRPGGYFLVRDHDVKTPEMDAFVSLAHTVFNAALGESWETNRKELRHFASIEDWIARIETVGFRHTGARLAQAGDPSDNLLLAFVRDGGLQ